MHGASPAMQHTGTTSLTPRPACACTAVDTFFCMNSFWASCCPGVAAAAAVQIHGWPAAAAAVCGMHAPGAACLLGNRGGGPVGVHKVGSCMGKGRGGGAACIQRFRRRFVQRYWGVKGRVHAHPCPVGRSHGPNGRRPHAGCYMGVDAGPTTAARCPRPWRCCRTPPRR